MEELEWSGVGHQFIHEGDVELRYATLGKHVDLVMRGIYKITSKSGRDKSTIQP